MRDPSGERRAAGRPVAGYRVAGAAIVLAAMLAAAAGVGGHVPGLAPAVDIGRGAVLVSPAGAPAAGYPQPGPVTAPVPVTAPAPLPVPTETVAGTSGTSGTFGTTPVDVALPGQLAPAMFTEATPDARARVAITYALAQLGLPYVWGGNGPARGDRGFDCSGLTTAAYGAAGILMPRTAATQYIAGPHVPTGALLLPGDLLFYGVPGAVHHVGLYLGSGRMVNAPTFGKPVQVAYYRWSGDDYLGATRPAASPGSLFSDFLFDLPPLGAGSTPPATPDDDVFVAPTAPVTPELLAAAVAPIPSTAALVPAPAAPAPLVEGAPAGAPVTTPLPAAPPPAPPSVAPPPAPPSVAPPPAPPSVAPPPAPPSAAPPPAAPPPAAPPPAAPPPAAPPPAAPPPAAPPPVVPPPAVKTPPPATAPPSATTTTPPVQPVAATTSALSSAPVTAPAAAGPTTTVAPSGTATAVTGTPVTGP